MEVRNYSEMYPKYEARMQAIAWDVKFELEYPSGLELVPTQEEIDRKKLGLQVFKPEELKGSEF